MRTAALALSLLLAASFPASAQYYDKIVAFRVKTPSCEANPDAGWIGHVSGTSRQNVRNQRQSVSFVGCFKTEAECNSWILRASGLMEDVVRQFTCAPRTR